MFDVIKVNPDNNLVFGWANVSIRKDGEQILDSHDEQIDPEDLEMAAYAFALQFRESGVMHQGDAVGVMVESFAVTKEKLSLMGLAEDALPLGWWVGFYVQDDAVFAKVKAGEYSMFSIQGIAMKDSAV